MTLTKISLPVPTLDNPQQLNSLLCFSLKKKKKTKKQNLFLIKPLQDLWTKALHKGKVPLFITVSIPELIKARENNCDIH